MIFSDNGLFYQISADLTVFIHFSFVMFVLAGQILIVIGAMAGWKWIRNFKFRMIHLLAILFVVFESLFKITCPLTTLEKWLRKQGGEVSYQGDFIAACVHDTLFMDAPDWVFTLCYSLFGFFVLVTFFIAAPQRKTAPNPKTEV